MSQIQEAYQTLAEIDRLLASIELKITRIEGNAVTLERNLTSFRELERLALRWLVIAQRMGLPEDVGNAINRISRLIVAIRMLQMSSNMLLATNPVTAAIGLAGMLGGMATLNDALVGY